jgi:F-box/leucine-rich repeat protein 2/20
VDFPLLTPDDLREVIADSLSERELYEVLVKRTDRLIRFYLNALEDEAWSTKHIEFYDLTLRWLTQRYLDNRLDAEYARAAVAGLQAHFDILESIVPKPLSIASGQDFFPINPLILGTMSPFFRQLIRDGAYDKQRNVISLDESDSYLCGYVLHYIEHGEVEDLWKWTEKEIESLISLTEKWGLDSLKEEAETILCRYVTQDNLIDKLPGAIRADHRIIMEKCVMVFNETVTGARLVMVPEGLGFEFLDFLDKTMRLFEPLKNVITHLIVSGQLTLEDTFEKVLKQCPKLLGLDISRSEVWSPFFSAIPERVRELNVARCAWLNDTTLHKLSSYIRQLHILGLMQNTQLSYLGFGELKNFRDLRSLDLSLCNQLGDSELRIVMRAAPQVIELSLLGCKRIGDDGFHDFARRGVHLQTVNLSRTSLTDGSLLEIGTRCKALQKITINHCLLVSELGLKAFLQVASQLQELSFKDSLSEEIAIELLRKQFPKVEIES